MNFNLKSLSQTVSHLVTPIFVWAERYMIFVHDFFVSIGDASQIGTHSNFKCVGLSLVDTRIFPYYVIFNKLN